MGANKEVIPTRPANLTLKRGKKVIRLRLRALSSVLNCTEGVRCVNAEPLAWLTAQLVAEFATGSLAQEVDREQLTFEGMAQLQ